jgi:hypothetical protein
MWSLVLRSQIQTYYANTLMIFETESINSTFLFKLSSIIILPIFTFVHLRRNFYFLKEKDFTTKFGTIYLNLWPLKSSVYKYTPLFCLKRLFIAMTTILIPRPITFIIVVYIYGSLFTLGYYINVRPMNSKIIQILDNTNEVFIFISGYAIILFSSWVYDFEYNR